MASGHGIVFKVAWPERERILGTFGGAILVRCHVIVIELALRELSNERARVATPDLTCRDQSAGGHHCVSKEHGSALNASTRANN